MGINTIWNIWYEICTQILNLLLPLSPPYSLTSSLFLFFLLQFLIEISIYTSLVISIWLSFLLQCPYSTLYRAQDEKPPKFGKQKRPSMQIQRKETLIKELARHPFEYGYLILGIEKTKNPIALKLLGQLSSQH